ASCRHFVAVSKSTISPLRTPRDGAWPTPRILSVPSGRLSPTTTQIFEVPISRPTIKLLFAILLLGFLLLVTNCFWRGRRSTRSVCLGSIFLYAVILVLSVFRHVHGDCFHDPRLDSGLQCIVDYIGCRTGKRHGNVALCDQVQSSQLLFGVITVIKEHLQPPQLLFEIIQTKHDA